MKLIDLDAEQDYLLDGKYKVKAGKDYVPIDEEWERGYTAGQMAERQEQVGRWEPYDDAIHRCSVCGFTSHRANDKVFKYCPCCGAKMDGEEQEHE